MLQTTRFLALFAVLFIGCHASFASDKLKTAEPAKEEGPHALVEQVTAQLLMVVKEGDKALKTDAQKYFDDVETVLEPVVSFKFIAKGVMSKRYWKQASPEQRQQFTTVFKKSMIETFAKGMANFSNLNIKVLPADADADLSGRKRVEVVQQITTSDGTSLVSYTMARGKSGQWKLINMILNGINLGGSFRDQFAQSAKAYKNDLDAVIANWGKEG